MKTILPLLLLALIISATGCKKASTHCGNPAIETPWVKRTIANHGTDSLRIYTAIYNGEENIIVEGKMGGAILYNCDSVYQCGYSAFGINGGNWSCINNGTFDQQTAATVLIYSSY